MQYYSKGFTAPSAPFPGATIVFECIRRFEGRKYVSGEWITNVHSADGGWVDHPGCDNVQDDMDAFIGMLAPFYDGTSKWTDMDTDEELSFWEMILRTLPENLGPSIE